ncbi:type IV pilus twitching motility protein PilT [Peptostreptococcus equinus]|uniref:ATPase, T2SS/T4P/T4SS family n=1 Tax=Peptostreptococcus equinus TaxID=3003601 RepID=A0ABY7JNW9_9FIRM|nr:ATPase, T2SS/T4P/T4SS family [Peptostreptococcus sp. CBA3647]WAW15042.1 ATPase, T2SS/T4P/T4SS family [Peptostreptococcus sp. CBA3647]
MSFIGKCIIKNNHEDISDIHIRENEFIYIRKNGLLVKTDLMAKLNYIQEFFEEIDVDFEKILKKLNINKQVDFSFELRELGKRSRANIFFSMDRICVVIRLIKDNIDNLKALNISLKESDLSNFSSGLVFVTGPTGSGKTSTLAAIIEYINQNENKHIICLEDPIEYTYISKKSLITQVEVKNDSKDFKEALKSSLRQDPDIIVIGEIRDQNTLLTCLRAAESGHLCFCTLHTLGVASCVERVANMIDIRYISNMYFQISKLTRCIMSQQLILTNYGERVPVIEFANIDRSLENLIREGKLNQIQAYILTNKNMISMDKELLKLYENRIISKKCLIRHCVDYDFIVSRLRKNGVDSLDI